jgi:hypothetical protein
MKNEGGGVRILRAVVTVRKGGNDEKGEIIGGTY